ncbi:MAG: hypothetical protein WC008_06325 [Bacilli bacterium]
MENAYCSVSQLESYLMTDISSSFEPFVERYIEAASRFIDNYTNREFGQKSESRYFIIKNPREILFDDIYAISSIEIYNYDESVVSRTLESSEYNLYPLNNDRGIVSKNRLVIKSGFPGLITNRKVKITGNWGVSSSASGETPRDIEFACVVLSAEAVRMGRDGGLSSSESLGDYSVSFEKVLETDTKLVNVKEVLNRYKIMEVF